MATGSVQIVMSATIDSIVKSMAKQFNITVTGEDYDEGTVVVATSDTQLVLKASLATAGWLIFYNADSTNYIEFGRYNSGSPTYTGRIPPRSAVSYYNNLATNDISFKANTAACKLHFLVFER